MVGAHETRRTFNLISLKAQKQNAWHANRTIQYAQELELDTCDCPAESPNSSKSREALKKPKTHARSSQEKKNYISK